MHRRYKEHVGKLLVAARMYYRRSRRTHLPWRHTKDPYKILVSEVMLQQTQVERVVPYYKLFIRIFPTARALAKAPLRTVLKHWSGLGYNRRARYLHEAAKVFCSAGAPRSGEMNTTPTPARRAPAALKDPVFWRSLPGVGSYTAAAVRAFAYNEPTIFVETNIRTVFVHHCFPRKKKITDTELLPLVEYALQKSRMQPREFYAALMDYGAYLKQSGVRLNSRSAHYVKQSKFEGSPRQKRAALLRRLLARGATDAELQRVLHS